jgi:hypothetical protein
MKQSDRNLAVIENFILHLTHSSEGDAGFKVPVSYTPEELYKVAESYIEENHVDGRGNLEDREEEVIKLGMIICDDEDRYASTEEAYELLLAQSEIDGSVYANEIVMVLEHLDYETVDQILDSL